VTFISVCIPVHNDSNWLKRAIESVLAQTYDSFEVVVSDNASTDDVRALLRAFDDPRIRYHRFDDLVPVNGSFNRALSLASSPWVHPLSADDRLHPGCLEQVAAVIAAEDGRHEQRIVLVAGGVCRVDDQGRPTDIGLSDKRQHRPIMKRTVAEGVHGPSSWLLANAGPGLQSWMPGALTFRRDALVTGGGFRPEMEMCADLELVLRISALGSVAYIDGPLLDYTVRGSSASHRLIQNDLRRAPQTTMVGRAWLSAMAVHEATRVVSESEHIEMRAAMCRSHLQRALWHRRHPAGGGWWSALRDVARALRISPQTAVASDRVAVTLGVLFLPRRLLRAVTVLGHRFGHIIV